jgi:hypothetical protein
MSIVGKTINNIPKIKDYANLIREGSLINVYLKGKLFENPEKILEKHSQQKYYCNTLGIHIEKEYQVF